MGNKIPESVLQVSVEGRNLKPGSLADQLGTDPVLLVFLRHLGCVFCHETINDLHHAVKSRSSYPALLFFYQGTPEDGDQLFGSSWRKARAVSDPQKFFYNAFGLKKGGFSELIGFGVLFRAFQAFFKGHSPHFRYYWGPKENKLFMPGLFLVTANRILWTWKFRHIGDPPNFSNLEKIFAETAGKT